jgi:cell division protein FtsB
MTAEQHKKEVEKLKSIENEIETFIANTNDSLFMKKWIEYLEQKNVCNLGMVNHLENLINQ